MRGQALLLALSSAFLVLALSHQPRYLLAPSSSGFRSFRGKISASSSQRFVHGGLRGCWISSDREAEELVSDPRSPFPSSLSPCLSFLIRKEGMMMA